MKYAHDQFAHVNPAFGLVCLRWLSQGFLRQRLDQRRPAYGLLWPWGILGLEPISVGKKRPYLMGYMVKEEVYGGISEEG